MKSRLGAFALGALVLLLLAVVADSLHWAREASADSPNALFALDNKYRFEEITTVVAGTPDTLRFPKPGVFPTSTVPDIVGDPESTCSVYWCQISATTGVDATLRVYSPSYITGLDSTKITGLSPTKMLGNGSQVDSVIITVATGSHTLLVSAGGQVR